MEQVSVTAFEARDLRSLRFASRTVAYFIISIYLFCAIGEFLNVDWKDPALPQIYGGTNRASVKMDGSVHKSSAVIVIAAVKAGYSRSAGLLNGCMIFSALSASNTGLYIASRSLYGMTRKVNPWRWFRFLRFLGTIWPKTGVPMWAGFVSFIAFYWQPFLQLHGGVAIADVCGKSQHLDVANSVSAYRDNEHLSGRQLSPCMGFPMSGFYTVLGLVGSVASRSV